jgi:Na+-driven multidrug efflux pump
LHERTRAVGIINVIAAATNIALDIVLIGAVGMGISGAAVATAVALGIIVIGYYGVARDCLATSSPSLALVLLPLVGGLVPSLALSGVMHLWVGVAAALALAILVVFVGKPFRSSDAALYDAIDMPPRIKRLALKGLALAPR